MMVTSYIFSTPLVVASIYWHEIPFLRICIPFIAGILTSQVWMHSWPLIAGASATCIFAVLAWILRPIYQRQLLRTFTLISLAFMLGVLVRQQAEPCSEIISAATETESTWYGIVQSAEQTTYGSKTTIRISGGLLVVAYVRDSSRHLLPGDTLVFDGSIESIPEPKNPFVFDVAKYYRGQGIHLRTFIDSAGIHDIRPDRRLNLFRQSAIVRNTLSNIINRHVPDPETNGVLHAMTIGVRSGLDDKLYEAYAKSGAIHILAISGLHVGIISFLLYLIIGKTKPTTRWEIKLYKSILLLGGIWSFAFVAGLSPSITRAALMFSLYLVGMILRRPVRGLNILACTAFVCLSIDPLQVNSLSFQFSYLALAGILIFYQPLYRILRPRHAINKFIWGTVVMSVAAQLFLVPFMIYYFQQISVISLLSGVIAIPGAYCILCGGILLFVLHFISSALAGWWGIMIDTLIGALNNSMVWMSELSWSYISGVYLPGALVAILSGITICGALYLLTRTKYWLYLSVVFATAFGLMQIIGIHRSARHEMFAIYDDENTLGVDFISANTCYTSFDILTKSTYKAKEIAAFRNYARVRTVNQTDLTRQHEGISLITIPGNSAQEMDSVLTIGIIEYFDEDVENMALIKAKADWIILPNTLKPWERRSAKAFYSEHKLRVHDLREDGSFYLFKQQNTHLHETTWQNITG